jgi:hypothetical protein
VPLRLATLSTSTSPTRAMRALAFSLFLFFLLVYGTLVEDDPEAVQQFGVLIEQPASEGKVCPLHSLADRKELDYRMGTFDGTPGNKVLCLLN